jgi:hypothetical protein
MEVDSMTIFEIIALGGVAFAAVASVFLRRRVESRHFETTPAAAQDPV